MPHALSVVAPANGSGKTRLILTLLEAFPRAFTAVKFSTVYRDGQNCPKTETTCACRALHGRYTVITDPGIIAQEGTDTGRMSRAGASRTLWCLSAPSAHADLWAHVSEGILDPDERVLTEGNRIVTVLEPEALVVVASPRVPRARWKKDAWDLMRKADLVVVNGFGEEAPGAGASALAGEIRAGASAQVIVQDVAAPLHAWSDRTLPALARRVIAGSAAARGAVEAF